ncbi:hypothetical protein ACFOEW_21530 [Alteromonas oceani]|uniref:Cardiolipin synthase N-terminal domain-containing protein n=1 Tax=Alteromonas oceani TaxID=2071609 RepID=A0ABV7K1V4_9ALTE|nr:hypothetical protein [Alteromonas oceani]
MSITLIIYVSLAVYVIISLAVSVFLIRRDDLTKAQKVLQIILAWLVPIIGALGLWQFNKSQDEPISRNKDFGGGASSSGNIASGGD